MGTTSIDGHLRLFHIDVRWEDGADAKLLWSFDTKHKLHLGAISQTHVVCASVDNDLLFYKINGTTLKLMDSAKDVQSIVGGKLTAMRFSPDEKSVAIAGTDKHAYVYQIPN